MYKSKKITSLLLVFMLILSLFMPSFAQEGSAALRNYVPQTDRSGERNALLTLTMEGSPTIDFKEISVNGYIARTHFAKYPSGSLQDLSEVATTFNFPAALTSVSYYNGSTFIFINHGETVDVDFSGGPIEFVFFIGGSPVANSFVSAGKIGTPITVNMKVKVDNLIDWCNDSYTTTNSNFIGKIPESNSANTNIVKGIIKNAWGLPATASLPNADDAYINVAIQTQIGKTVQEAISEGVINGVALAPYFEDIDSNYVYQIKKHPRPLPSSIAGISHFIFSENNISCPNGGVDGTGWIYKVNNKVPNYGIAQYYLTKFESTLTPGNDVGIEWKYTLDWGKDCGASW